MNWSNLFQLCMISAAYLFVFVIVPFWVRGFHLSGDNVMDNLVSSYIMGNIVIINCVLLLSLFGIYYGFTLALTLAAVSIFYRFFFRRAETFELFRRIEEHMINYKEGYLHRNVLIKMILRKLTGPFVNIFKKMKNPPAFIILAVAFGCAAYTRGYHAVVNFYYGTSDMYAHTEWIKNININIPFSGGVYPFGMHSAISAVSMLFKIDVVTVMRMIGFVIGMLIVFSLYYILRKTFRSAFAVNTAMIFYCVLDVYNPLAIERQMLALPQEYGMIFLYFAGYFLYQYMKEKKMPLLVYFSGSVALTLMSHFYITVYAVVLCGAVFAAGIFILKRKVFTSIVVGVVCSLMVAIIPMSIGVAKGIHLQDSLYWALGMLETEEEIADISPVLDENAPKPLELLRHPIRAMEDSDFFSNERLNSSGMFFEWFVYFAVSCTVGLAYPLLRFKKDTERRWDIMGLSLYAVLTFIIRAMPIFNLPAIMEIHRLGMFLIFAVPLVLAVPLELFYEVMHRFGKKTIYAHIAAASLLTGGLGYYTYAGSHYGRLCNVVQMQYDGAVISYYDIVNEKKDLSWTIVSTNDEYSLCLHKGYHYTLSNFVIFMNEYDAMRELIIPTEYIYFYVDKRPQNYSVGVDLGADKPLFEPLDPEDVYSSIYDLVEINRNDVLYIYKNLEANRRIQAKALAWAEEYMKYFPDEMRVFYEDEDIIIFELHQNPYALNNLSIPYDGNNWGVWGDNL